MDLRLQSTRIGWLVKFFLSWMARGIPCYHNSLQVVEEGTHENLLKRGGSYFQLVQCQLSAGEKQTIEAKDAENSHRQWQKSSLFCLLLKFFQKLNGSR